MKVLAIYGAGGLGREVLELARIINRSEKRWDRLVFIDDGNVEAIVSGCEVYSYESAREEFKTNLEVIVGIGEPLTRKMIYEKLNKDCITTPNLIHPDVYIPESAKIGFGVIIQIGCFISCNVLINNYTYIHPHCNIGHDDILDEGCMISGFCNIGGEVKIGKWTYLGLSTAIKQTVKVGDYSIIGMGSVVLKDIPDEMIALGNPARPMVRNTDKVVFKK